MIEQRQRQFFVVNRLTGNQARRQEGKPDWQNVFFKKRETKT
jgi:hypothetical protein